MTPSRATLLPVSGTALPPRVEISLADSVRDYWLQRVHQHTADSYAGVPLSKFPEDLRVYEHLLWLARPEIIIELGSQYGGSALWFRDRLRTLAAWGLVEDPQVICVDVDIDLARRHIGAVDPSFDGLVLLEGSVTDPALPDRVAQHVPEGARCLVIEDSAHVYETTYAALEGFARFVAPGGYLVVEDGCVDVEEMRPFASWPRGVLPALRDWLSTPAGQAFAPRQDLELYGVTCHPHGFLQRRADEGGGEPAADGLPSPKSVRAPGAGLGAAGGADATEDPRASNGTGVHGARDGSADRHVRAVEALQAGDLERAHDLLREDVAERVDPDVLNDLAVVTQQLGRLDDAEGLLRTAKVVAGRHGDVEANLSTLAALRESEARAWRSSGVSGADPVVPERAYPGMPLHGTMGEHAIRYAFVLSMLGGHDVLDLGCGTGYGSEMLTWSAARVRGFDLWEPGPDQHPRWPGGAELHYGHDLQREPLPDADAAVMFEVIEHLPEAAAALRLAWSAVPMLIASFPNPRFHGSHVNPHHVNDWSFERFQAEVLEAARGEHERLEFAHFHQPQGSVLLTPGRDPDAPFWVMVARRPAA